MLKMNFRVLLIVFTTISYLGVTKSTQTEESQPRIITSLPVLTDATSQTPQIIHLNETNINIEYHNTSVKPNSTTHTSQPSVKPSSTTPLPNTPTTVPTKATTTTTSTSSTTTNSTTANTTTETPKNSTTSLPTTVPSHKVTTAASESTTSSISAHDRQFDGPSFIGGIVLTFGLIAIGFIAFKFYKAGKLDMNYRTL